MKKLTFILLFLLVGCSTLEERAAKAKLSGKNDFVSFKILDIDRTSGYRIQTRGYYPNDNSIDVVNVELEIKNTSNFPLEVSLQPVIPLQGQELHKIIRVYWGGNFIETLKTTTDDRYETEAVNLKNETLEPGYSMFRIFAFIYPKDKLPNQLIFRVRKNGDPNFEEIPVMIEKTN
ncbi:putative lipoprotein [Leptospira terpstrae serovar Hualin str. LT 11-33 = ATCC 700639]|uniref:Lipoprotein n=2 Tax=Leptospira TaxID=171 RepID=N1W0V9_9LEPT|nr:putative lipoprotein [Leptospira terpstrae serovar Hualin str. LT 11-33 = ATCC 700639]